MATWRACTDAGFLVAMGVLVSVACERTARREAPTVTINDEKLPSDPERILEPLPDANPDWTVVEDYLERQNAGGDPDGVEMATRKGTPVAT